MKVLENTTGDICEVGAGLFSTPYLHWFCFNNGFRRLVTYENDPLFYEFAKTFQSGYHKVRKIDNWNDMDFKRHFSVVLIDHHPEARRSVDVMNYAKSDIIVIHDTERPDKYKGIEEAINSFKYRYHWIGCKPHVTVVSNTTDLNKIF